MRCAFARQSRCDQRLDRQLTKIVRDPDMILAFAQQRVITKHVSSRALLQGLRDNVDDIVVTVLNRNHARVLVRRQLDHDVVSPQTLHLHLEYAAIEGGGLKVPPSAQRLNTFNSSTAA